MPGQLLESSAVDTNRYWDAENVWYQEAPVSRLAKALAQYDVYRSIVRLPGDVVEFGTFKGASLVRLATYREVLESAHARVIYGFDTFGEMPEGEATVDADVARLFARPGHVSVGGRDRGADARQGLSRTSSWSPATSSRRSPGGSSSGPPCVLRSSTSTSC